MIADSAAKAAAAPMQYQNLYRAGDAAHRVPPSGGNGMNMALYDVDVLASALVSTVCDRDTAAPEGYCDIVLPHVWRYREFSAWMTDTLHDGGDPALHGCFRQMAARARLDELFNSPAAARLHSDYQHRTA